MRSASTETISASPEQEEMTRLTLRGVNALLNHEITGNGIENLKKVRDDITEHLIDR